MKSSRICGTEQAESGIVEQNNFDRLGVNYSNINIEIKQSTKNY